MSVQVRYLHGINPISRPQGIVDPTLLQPLNPPNIFSDATGEMRFGRGSHSLNTVWPVQNPPPRFVLNDTSPVYASNYLTTINLDKQGILSPWDERDEETLCVVCQITSAIQNQAIIGTLSGTFTEGGWMFYRVSASLTYRVLTRGITNPTGFAVTLTLPTGMVDGVWAFFAIAHTLIGTPQRRIFVGGGDVGDVTVTTNGSKVLSNTLRQHAVGSIHYLNGYYSPLSVANVIRFPSAKSYVEMAAIYAQVKSTMAARGLTVF